MRHAWLRAWCRFLARHSLHLNQPASSRYLMKKSRHFRLIICLVLLSVGLAGALGYWLTLPSDEITRAQLDQLVREKLILEGAVTPTPYPGFYHLEGKSLSAGKPRNFSLTTHLESAEVKDLFAQPQVKVEVPGMGLKGQAVNIISVI